MIIKYPKTGYIAALVVFVLGISALGYLIYYGITNYSEEYQRMAAPGKQVLQLNKPGQYTIFYEFVSEFNGKYYDTSEVPPDMTYIVTDMSTGSQVTIKHPYGKTTYNLSDHYGVSVKDFDITKPGKYELAAQYNSLQEGPEVVLAIGQSHIGAIVACIFGGFALLFVTLGLSFLIAIVTFIRDRNRKQQQPVTQGMGPFIQ
ncbi:MAG: hypothetical protein ACM3UZ_16945 [Acidobacteriota bacterium]